MRTVIWNKLAKEDFYENIEYLLTDWSERDAQTFIDEVYEIEYLLKNGIIDFQETNKSGVRRCVVCRQITLFYRIYDNNKIEFLRFWNNYRDSEKLLY